MAKALTASPKLRLRSQAPSGTAHASLGFETRKIHQLWTLGREGPSVKAVRCAIYTRVSTDQGLDQEFNSLDAQYEASSAYIKESGPCRLDPDPVAL